jgi:hypothetical protein
MSNSNSMAANLVASRGNRCSAVLLTWMEDNAYEFLPEDVQFQLRRTILDQINGFKDLAIDIVKSDVAAMNQVWVEKLDAIHSELRRLSVGV